MTGANTKLSEIEISRAWHEGRAGASLRTTDERAVRVIHRGTWSHGLGPDFRDAMVEFDGRSLATGSIEIHLRTAGWREHGHHLDPAYNDAILHIVVRHDGAETRRQDGALVPVVELGAAAVSAPIPAANADDWSRFGGEVCAADLTRRRPGDVRTILWQLGDRRMAAKSARFEARLTSLSPGDVLYQELWDGLGYAANREPMRAVSERLPLAALEATLGTVEHEERLPLTLALLLGVAGFLPLSPADALAAGLAPGADSDVDRLWRERGGPWHDARVQPTRWVRARVRPANHPVRRLAAGAALIARARSGLVAQLLDPLRNGDDGVDALRDLTSIEDAGGLGPDRATGLVGNVLIPFALALAEHTGDRDLAAAASSAWERLPAAEPNQITRRAHVQVAGSARLTGLGSRGQQGLIHLDQTLCAPRRCYECPVARRVLAEPGA